MRAAIPNFTAIALLSCATGLLVLGHPAEVRAQTAFCPSGTTLQSGLCTNAPDQLNPTGAFSGAALASQALSELSETTTQESVGKALKSIATRRDEEEQRCAEGFSRVDGTCRRNPLPVSEVAASGIPTGLPEEGALKKTKKTRAVAVSHERAIAPTPRIVRLVPPSPPLFAGVPVEPAVRFAGWTQIYGDYEKRSAAEAISVTAGNFGCQIGANCNSSFLLPVSVQSHTGTIGFLVGADLTSRGLFSGNDGLITGVITGYVSSNLILNSSSGPSTPDFTETSRMGVGSARVNANFAGPTAGAYATYFNGGFSTDLTLKVDALTLKETFNDLLSFTNPACNQPPGPFFVCAPPTSVPFSGGGSVSLLNGTIAGNLNYRFDLYPNFWVEPTTGAQYTNSSYGSNAFQLGLKDGNLVMVQGGARFGTTTVINNRVLMTTTLTGLAYDDVLVAGGFIPAAAVAGQNLLVQQDQGKVRGRGILALNFDCGQGITSFVQGEVRGGSGVFGAGGKAGVRYQW
jgi:hypothetical protein